MHQPRQQLLNRHSIFSSPLFLTALLSLVSDPHTKSVCNYFSIIQHSNAPSVYLQPLLHAPKPSTTSHHSKAFSRSHYLCLRSPIPNLPKHLNGASKTALFNHAHNSSTNQYQNRETSRNMYKRGQLSKLIINP